MPLLRFLAALLTAVVIHALGSWVMPEFSRYVDLFLVVTVIYALSGNSLAGMLAGLVAGLTHDVLTTSLFALHGFADTVVGYSLARLAQRLVIDRMGGAFMVTFLAAVVQQVLLAALVLLLLPEPTLPEPLGAAIRATVVATATVTVLLASNRLRDSLAQRRQRRSQRLHLD